MWWVRGLLVFKGNSKSVTNTRDVWGKSTVPFKCFWGPESSERLKKNYYSSSSPQTFWFIRFGEGPRTCIFNATGPMNEHTWRIGEGRRESAHFSFKLVNLLDFASHKVFVLTIHLCSHRQYLSKRVRLRSNKTSWQKQASCSNSANPSSRTQVTLQIGLRFLDYKQLILDLTQQLPQDCWHMTHSPQAKF